MQNQVKQIVKRWTQVFYLSRMRMREMKSNLLKCVYVGGETWKSEI